MSLTVEDRLEIHELYARYAYAFDSNDGASWADVFTADGRFLRPGEPDIVGSDALEAFVGERNAMAPGVSHHTTSITLEDAGDGARGRAYVLVLRVHEGALRLRNMGRYADELVAVDGRWRFRQREYTPWISPEMADARVSLELSA